MGNKLSFLTQLKPFLKRHVVLPMRLRKQYKHDYHKYLASSFMVRKDLDFDNLKGALTFHAHALEKGFVHDNFRAGFGTKAINALIYYLELYLETGYSQDELRFNIAVDTLNEYLKVHRQLNVEHPNTKRVKHWLEAHQLYKTDKIDDGGFFVQEKSDLDMQRYQDFQHFSDSRHSVRNFEGTKIDQQVLNRAITLSGNAPSVCNRQAYKVYQVHDENQIKELLHVQGGINGMAEGISDLLIVTTNAKYFRSIDERNQPYIDGGIFAMNLLYALHYYDIAACPLNADLTLEKEAIVKDTTKIQSSECVILFIAIGTFKDENKIPLSKREGYQDILVQVSNTER